MIRKYGDLEGLEPGEEPVKEGFVRIYEFLHGWDDITVEEYERDINDPFAVVLREEIQKEINREIIELINKNAVKE